MEDLFCIPGQPGPPTLVCTGPGCINCPPEGQQVKREDAHLIPVRYVKRVEDLFCIPGQPGPPTLVCTGPGCINCPPEAETEKEKRADKVCIPHCVGEHRCQCDDEGEQEVKRADKVCIPHCVGEHCQCEETELVKREETETDSFCIGPLCTCLLFPDQCDESVASGALRVSG